MLMTSTAAKPPFFSGTSTVREPHEPAYFQCTSQWLPLDCRMPDRPALDGQSICCIDPMSDNIGLSGSIVISPRLSTLCDWATGLALPLMGKSFVRFEQLELAEVSWFSREEPSNATRSHECRNNFEPVGSYPTQ